MHLTAIREAYLSVWTQHANTQKAVVKVQAPSVNTQAHTLLSQAHVLYTHQHMHQSEKPDSLKELSCSTKHTQTHKQRHFHQWLIPASI